MKNQNHVRRAVRFLRTELEVTLAVLVLLAFIVGFSFAQTPTSKIAAQQLNPEASNSSQLNIGTQAYSGIIFGANQLDGYKTVTKLNGGSQYYDTDGITLVNTSATYTYSATLASPLDNKPWYLNFEGTPASLSVNSIAISSPAQALDLTGATSISLSASGNLVIKSLTHTPGTVGSGADKAESIASLFIAPATTKISAGATRKFIVVALDKDGQSISADDAVSWTSSDPKVATIGKTTGLLTAVAAGQVQITARANSNTLATATVTVVGKEDMAPIENTVTPKTLVEPPQPFSADKDPAQSTNKIPPTQVEPPVPFQVEPSLPFTAHLSQSDVATATAGLPLTRKIAYQAKSAFTEIRNTITEIFTGRDVTNTDSGQNIHYPSAFERIGSFFANLF